MQRKRQFLFDLYKNRIGQISFLDYFKNDRFLRKKLFEQYLNTDIKPNFDFFYEINCRPLKLKKNHEKEVLYWQDILHGHIRNQDLPNAFYTPKIEQTFIFESLAEAFKLIKDFKNRILLLQDYDPIKYAETFAYNFTGILKNLEIKELTVKVLSDFLSDNDNLTIDSYLIVNTRNDFEKKFNKTYDTAWEYYRELKGYANKKIREELNCNTNNNNRTIAPRVEALFTFIDFLDKNKKEYLETYLPVVKTLTELGKLRSSLNPKSNYKSKLEFDLVQEEIKEKFAPLYNNVSKPIMDKLKELDLWNGDDGFISVYNLNIVAINECSTNFTENSIKKIRKFKSKYVAFRNETNTSFLSLDNLFHNLDDVLKVLFDFFKDTNENEFENFEKNIIEVDSIYEVFENLKRGNTNISIPLRVIENRREQNSIEQQNLKIAFGLIGENDTNTVSIIYHHIPKILEHYKISNLAAKNILLTMRGAFSPEKNRKIIPEIVNYLNEFSFNPESLIGINEQTNKTNKENNFKQSIIEDYLLPFKEENILVQVDYTNLVDLLVHYFDKQSFPAEISRIKVGRVNVKRFGWALNEIFKAHNSNNEKLPIEYLRFAKQNISIFEGVSFDENNYLKSNLYKYFKTKIRK